jgi:hydroxyethylthiazole kinase-like uncharacterized protein yjeF
MKILTAAEMREVDRLTSAREGISAATLMENAGASVARFIQARFPDYKQRRIVVLCGKGNNGGDGFVVARHLRVLGADPAVYSFAAPEEMKGEANSNCKRWQESGGALSVIRAVDEWQKASETFAAADIIVDALLGTGVRGAVTGLLGAASR